MPLRDTPYISTISLATAKGCKRGLSRVFPLPHHCRSPQGGVWWGRARALASQHGVHLGILANFSIMVPMASVAPLRRRAQAGDGRSRAAGRGGSADGSGTFCKRSRKKSWVCGVPRRRPHEPSPAPDRQPTGRRPADADARVRPVPVANRRPRRYATPLDARVGRRQPRQRRQPWRRTAAARCVDARDRAAVLAARYRCCRFALQNDLATPPQIVHAKATATRRAPPAPARRARRHAPPVRRSTGVVAWRRPTGRRCGVAAAPPALLVVRGLPPLPRPTAAGQCRTAGAGGAQLPRRQPCGGARSWSARTRRPRAGAPPRHKMG